MLYRIITLEFVFSLAWIAGGGGDWLKDFGTICPISCTSPKTQTVQLLFSNVECCVTSGAYGIHQ